MRSMPLALLAAIVTGLLGWSTRAAAHPVGVSQGEYLYREGKVYGGVTFARRELADALPWLRGEGGRESVVAFEENRERLGEWLKTRLSASSGDGPCAPSFDGMRFDGDAVALALSYACSGVVDRLEIDARFVTVLAPGHRHIAGWMMAADRREEVATRERTRLSFAVGAATSTTSASIFAPLMRMGVEHILTGYDHLLFLLGLLLVGGPLRSIIAAVSAFTVAHSITLALAALDVWAPSARFVEPCIALSIAYIGVENWFVQDARGRWRITFPFGLVHGFGFAGALREVALPRSSIPTALFGFNLGVELGQIAIVAILLPVVVILRKRIAWERVGMRVCTMAVAVAGVAWFIVRLRASV